jgi:hypothetical protein
MSIEVQELSLLADCIVERLAGRLRAQQERLLDRAEVAERLGVCERTVSAMVERQELPPPLLHTSGVARWEWQQVLKFLEKRSGRSLRRGRGRYDNKLRANISKKAAESRRRKEMESKEVTQETIRLQMAGPGSRADYQRMHS